MDSFTVAPELKGTKGDIIAARIEVPILVVMIYGIVEFIRLEWSQDYYLYTYAPVLARNSHTAECFYEVRRHFTGLRRLGMGDGGALMRGLGSDIFGSPWASG